MNTIDAITNLTTRILVYVQFRLSMNYLILNIFTACKHFALKHFISTIMFFVQSGDGGLYAERKHHLQRLEFFM